MVDGNELQRQKVQEVISTNKGEWPFDLEQGIKFDNVLGKGVTDEEMRAEIEDGLQQVDEKLIISEFTRELNGRNSVVEFTALDEETNTKMTVSTKY